MAPKSLPTTNTCKFVETGAFGLWIGESKYKLPINSRNRVMGTYFLNAKGIKNSNKVFHKIYKAGLLNFRRLIRESVASEIRGNCVKPCIRQRNHLMTPWIPDFRKSMQQQHIWTCTQISSILQWKEGHTLLLKNLKTFVKEEKMDDEEYLNQSQQHVIWVPWHQHACVVFSPWNAHKLN